jgi:mannose PTS system EIIA component
MSIGILLVTHGKIGEVLLESACHLLGEPPVRIKNLGVLNSMRPEQICDYIRELTDSINQGDGVLILSDLIGATPSNNANRVCHSCDLGYPMRNIAGLNLPMLLRLWNHLMLNAEMDLATAAQVALEGGHKGIIDLDSIE